MPTSELISNARELRKEQTKAETHLWQALRDRKLGGWKWRRQAPQGPYIVDFYCTQANLIIEVDGATHNSDAEVAYDLQRTRFLEAQVLGSFALAFSSPS